MTSQSNVCVVSGCAEDCIDERNMCARHTEYCEMFLWVLNNTSIADMIYEHVKKQLIPDITAAIQSANKDKPILYVPA